uniref:CW-type domain-containing protein n=1 Tax=Chaetoceros debilis TaxID=122233 RepID=A0A7S3Q115_9STRA|eukprot:CAMPEP_0194090598 /NCGR_PEP_ID=MMETSP0149-20130528/39759_1 /TAXON_ID=122233 /ORGANISM="Chaetoceros debilis, Strain MM31A-1" /LENGTH=1372 /DNA_ID=CAMNT_0038774895 /DNA_START=164 /DNA_END=4282 /DNA_ORIENTATION=+
MSSLRLALKQSLAEAEVPAPSSKSKRDKRQQSLKIGSSSINPKKKKSRSNHDAKLLKSKLKKQKRERKLKLKRSLGSSSSVARSSSSLEVKSLTKLNAMEKSTSSASANELFGTNNFASTSRYPNNDEQGDEGSTPQIQPFGFPRSHPMDQQQCFDSKPRRSLDHENNSESSDGGDSGKINSFASDSSSSSSSSGDDDSDSSSTSSDASDSSTNSSDGDSDGDGDDKSLNSKRSQLSRHSRSSRLSKNSRNSNSNSKHSHRTDTSGRNAMIDRGKRQDMEGVFDSERSSDEDDDNRSQCSSQSEINEADNVDAFAPNQSYAQQYPHKVMKGKNLNKDDDSDMNACTSQVPDRQYPNVGEQPALGTTSFEIVSQIQPEDSSSQTQLITVDSSSAKKGRRSVISTSGSVTRKKKKQKTVPPPTQEVLAWVMGMSQGKQRRKIAVGMRVKVRFVKPTVKWYGGLVTAVATGGHKIRIKYDDGNREEASFPDKEIVVDAEGNGRHKVAAGGFVPRALPIPMSISSVKKRKNNKNDVVDGISVHQKKKKSKSKVHEDFIEQGCEHRSGSPKNTENERIHNEKPCKELIENNSFPLVRSNNSDGEKVCNENGNTSNGEDGIVPCSPAKNLKESLLENVEKEVATATTTTSHMEESPATNHFLERNVNLEAPIEPMLQSASPVKEVVEVGHKVTSSNQPTTTTNVSRPTFISPGESDFIPEKVNAEEIISTSPPKMSTILSGTAEGEILKDMTNPSKVDPINDDGQRFNDALKSKIDCSTPTIPKKEKEVISEEVKPSMVHTKQVEDENRDLSPNPNKDQTELRLVNYTNKERNDEESKPPNAVVGNATSSEDEGASKQSAGRNRRTTQKAVQRISTKDERIVGDSRRGRKRRKEKEDGRRGKKRRDEDIIQDNENWVQCELCEKWRLIPSVENLPEKWYCELNTSDPKRNSCEADEQTPQEVEKQRRQINRAARNQAKRNQSISPSSIQRNSKSKGVELINQEAADKKRRSPSIEKSLSEVSRTSDSGEEQARLGKSRLSQSEDTAIDSHETATQSRKQIRRGRPTNDERNGRRGRKKQKEEKQQEWVQCEKCEKWRRLPRSISAKTLPDTWFCSMNTWDPRSASCAVQADYIAEEEKNRERAITPGNEKTAPAGGSKPSYRNLIRRPTRPISERMRAAESIFSNTALEVDGEGSGNPPVVLYATSSVFQQKLGFGRIVEPPENEGRVPLFELMSQSQLWRDLQFGDSWANGSSQSIFSSSPTSCAQAEVMESIKAMICIVLESDILAVSDMLLSIQCMEWEQDKLMELSATCTYESILFATNELEKEGHIEVTGVGVVPRYKKSDNSDKASLVSVKRGGSFLCRSMKLSKPWKERVS